MINELRIADMQERYCNMTDAVALLIKNINNIVHKYTLKANNANTRYQIEELIWNEIQSIQAKYPQISDEFNNIRFLLVEVDRNRLQLMPCNLLTSLIFNRIDNV